MNKTAIKNYAIWARNELIEKVSQKAEEFKINETDSTDTNLKTINDVPLNTEQINQRKSLIEKIKKSSYQEVIEEVAYTWFNRFIALRFMEVNGYLPSMVKVFTDEENNFKPEILSQAIHIELNGLDKNKVIKLKEENKDDELFKYLITVQCNDLNTILPGMFKKIDNYTVLLFPDNQLREGSVVERLVRDIPEEDWKDQVQIIGWLYQYYNTEPKDKVFSDLKKKKKITKEKIPAATQLFTPDWIVRYMVENSLGKLWVEGHPNNDLKDNWKYYIEEAEQTKEVNKQLEEIRKEYSKLEPKDIKCIDPAMGSGHILVYMFDLLMQIYSAYGYSQADAVSSILENNLYGLDIDERAYQLAYFSLMMKARQYSRRILRDKVTPNLYSFAESDNIDREIIKLIIKELDKEEQSKTSKEINKLLDNFRDAKNLGSILVLEDYDFELLDKFIQLEKTTSFGGSFRELNYIKKIIEIARVLDGKYHIVVTNPPYMGSSGMGPGLSKYVKDNYKDTKSDLFAVFMETCEKLLIENGLNGMITQHSWMFISSYENYRKSYIRKTDIVNMIHLGTRAFEDIGGEVVQTTSYIIRKSKIESLNSSYIRLIDFPEAGLKEEKTIYAIQNPDCGYYYETNKENFYKIPKLRIGYWLSKATINNINKSDNLGKYAYPCTGMQTGKNPLFVRYWYEISNVDIINNGGKIWKYYMMGGKGIKWFGNLEKVINWKDSGKIVKNFKGSVIRNEKYFGKRGISWKRITSGVNMIRCLPENHIFDQSADSLFPKDYSNYYYLFGLLNSKIISNLLEIFSATINLTSGSISEIPVVLSEKYNNQINILVRQNIDLAEKDWNNKEISWSFKRNPLVNLSSHIESAYEVFKENINNSFIVTKNNEEILNEIYIKLYGLEDELIKDVGNKFITHSYIFDRTEDIPENFKETPYIIVKRDVITSILSYFIGCMMGRYSLDEEGLIYAGGEFDISKYHRFIPDSDAIVAIGEENYFSDDAVVSRFIEFVNVVYESDTLEENLAFIADALGGKGSSREVIRNYFLKDFYKDHLKIYQKRPIYWLFDAGKKHSFKALVYMHRYEKDTIAKLRTDYIHPLQDRYRLMIEDIESRIDSVDTSQKVKLNKELKDLKDKAEELRVYEEKIHHLADQMIEIDLDDGVEYNYGLFKDVLAKRI